MLLWRVGVILAVKSRFSNTKKFLSFFFFPFYSGNPYPPVIPKQRDKRGLLTNILLDEMRKDYYRDKYQKQPPPPATASENTEAEIKSSTTDPNDSSESKDSSMESENYHKDANLSVKAPNADGTPVWPIP